MVLGTLSSGNDRLPWPAFFCRTFCTLSFPTPWGHRARAHFSGETQVGVARDQKLQRFPDLCLSRSLWRPLLESSSVPFGKPHRSEAEGQLVELAVEAERHLVVLVVHRCAGIDPDIEGLANRKQERDRVRHLQRGDVLAVHLQYAGAALCDAGAVIREIEHDRVLARRERLLAFAAELYPSLNPPAVTSIPLPPPAVLRPPQ